MQDTRIVKAFTLIELLIVVAIIAILAAIAVPNFLEAQTRSKVSRVKADMRTLDTCLSSYYVDFNTFPACHRFGITLRDGVAAEPEVLERITTPVAYCTQAAFRDPFLLKTRTTSSTAAAQAVEAPTAVNPVTDAAARLNSYIYQACSAGGRMQTTTDSFSPVAFSPKATVFFLHSAGPDSNYQNLGGILANDLSINGPIQLIYDPTNGTVSFGSIYRANGAPDGSTTYAGGLGLFRAINSQN